MICGERSLRRGSREKGIGAEKKNKRRKGHFYLGERHLNKLQRSAIKKLKLPECWVTTATKSLSKVVKRADKK